MELHSHIVKDHIAYKVYKAAGDDLKDYLNELGYCMPGQAEISKSYNRNKRPKLFKAMKGKYKPFRFIHIDNDKFLFNINKEKDISFIRNNFFE